LRSRLEQYMPDQYCTQADCDARTGCIFGELNPVNCKYHLSNSGDGVAASVVESPMPWHGSVLGLTELQFVAARGRPNLIGLVGAHNAGKTSFLTALYLMLYGGLRMPDKSFAGSFTLRAWEILANNLRYPTDTKPMFPRHTPITQDRIPGLLHLAFRNERKRLEDYVFTDAPGEWFTNWAIHKNADNAAGARWIAQNADEFLFFIDSEELAGSDCGVARNLITQLAQRLADETNDRRVLVIWSKADYSIDAAVRDQVTARINRYLPHAEHCLISVTKKEHAGMNSVAEKLLAQKGRQGRNLEHLNCEPDPSTTDPFFRYFVGQKR
jgi:hypothetical protein